MLSGDIASCMALTAWKSSGAADRISIVVPSASSAYTLPSAACVFVMPSLLAHGCHLMICGLARGAQRAKAPSAGTLARRFSRAGRG